jgi:F-type H+-transporting ATPase subunit epsilon
MAEGALQVLITTPEGQLFRGEAGKVILPAHDGELGVLPRHAPLIAELGVGELRLEPAGGGAKLSFFVAGGFAQVLENKVTVLATRAEPTPSIDAAKAEEALKALLAEPPPKGMKPEARAEREMKIRAARMRIALAAKKRAAG